MFIQKEISGQEKEVLRIENFRVYSIASEIDFNKGWPVNINIREKFLNINRLPSLGFDPLRIVRVLSLYGWNIRMFNTIHQLQNETRDEPYR